MKCFCGLSLSWPPLFAASWKTQSGGELREGEDKHSSYQHTLMTEQTYPLLDEAATRALASSIGTQLKAGDLVFLSGPLGAGKTTFAQQLAHSLGVNEPVSSPTFVLINEYAGRVPLLHCDAYRLEGLEAEELADAGLEDLLSRTDAVRLIEWPEMVTHFLPRPTWKIEIEFQNEGKTRRARVENLL